MSQETWTDADEKEFQLARKRIGSDIGSGSAASMLWLLDYFHADLTTIRSKLQCI